jgi:predicted ester cyclase
MATEQNKALVRRFYKAFATNDQGTLRGLLVPDLVAFSHGAPGPQDREVHLQGIEAWNAAFEGTRFTIGEQIAEGDKVATLTTLRAVHSKGDWQGIAPTGTEIVVSGVSIERIRDDKIAERRVMGDWLGLMQQLGLIPASGRA